MFNYNRFNIDNDEQELLKRISRDLNIPENQDESYDNRVLRILYSAACSIAKATLELTDSQESEVSSQRFRDYFLQSYNTYQRFFGSSYTTLKITPEDLFEKFFKNLIAVGGVYHRPHWLKRPQTRVAKIGNFLLFRGESQDNTAYPFKLSTSGSGKFYIDTSGEFKENTDSLQEVFGLFSFSINSYWDDLVKRINWVKISPLKISNYKFFSLHHYQNEYFQIKPDSPLTLARTDNFGEREYYLYKFSDQNHYISALSSWQTGNGEYLNIAISALKKIGTFPSIAFCQKGNIVTVHFNFLLPPAEEAFFHYFSWPVFTDHSLDRFKREMNADLFFAIKEVFEEQGYSFIKKGNL